MIKEEQLVFRKELKYVLNKMDFIVLQERFKTITSIDKHAKEKGKYTIISLYFDDYKETCYNQVLDGLNERWKWRIRYYNFDSSYICLEKKYKLNGLTKKQKVRLTKEQVIDIINLKNININVKNHKLLNEFYLQVLGTLRPKAIIIYDRIPFVYNAGNVRVTLDYNISSSNEFNNFFNENIKLIPLTEVNQSILEVKYDDFIPDFIRFKLELNHLTRTAYSKYVQGVNALKLLYK